MDELSDALYIAYQALVTRGRPLDAALYCAVEEVKAQGARETHEELRAALLWRLRDEGEMP